MNHLCAISLYNFLSEIEIIKQTDLDDNDQITDN